MLSVPGVCSITESFRYLKCRKWRLVLNLIAGDFLGVGFAVSISRIHTAYIMVSTSILGIIEMFGDTTFISEHVSGKVSRILEVP